MMCITKRIKTINMEKIYQPEIIARAKMIVETLDESGFFVDYEIENKNYATNYFCEKLTEKFIEGKLLHTSIV